MPIAKNTDKNRREMSKPDLHQAGNAEMRINTADAADVHQKLGLFAPPQIALLLKIFGPVL
jgi:hypothetical protein